MNDEFYVGYATKVPDGLRRQVVAIIVGLNVITVVVAVLLVIGQKPFAASAFEYQQYRELAGQIEERPYPSLLVPRPGVAETAYSRYLLVAPGKHGASPLVAGLDGARARVRGSLIYREANTMIELAPGSAPVAEGPGSIRVGPTSEGMVTLSGEIVDSKCYFGVMNPGNGKVHRDCAARCISGGIPPVFVADGKTLLLVGGDGRQLNREVLDFVAEPITVEGLLERSGDTLVLRTEPRSIRRVSR